MTLHLVQLLFIVLGGFVAGVINGTVGGGSLLTYPLLLANGLPPVLAAATNTTGLAPGNLAALVPHRKGDTVSFRAWRKQAVIGALGALTGGLLLIALPEKVFEFIVPILLLAASLMTLRKPKPISDAPTKPRHTMAALFGSGIYQGYFGPGMGVIAMAVLLRDGRLSVQQSVVIKNLLIGVGNVVVAVLFVVSGHVVWPAALALMLGVSVGGWTGGHVARFINATATRYVMAGIGVFSAYWFVINR